MEIFLFITGMNDPVIAIRGTTFHNKLYQSSCACLQNLSTKFRSYMLKLIHIFGHVLMVNSSYYGRCYVKKKKNLYHCVLSLKAMLREKFFSQLATQQTFVASRKKKLTCNTLFCNCNSCVAGCKKSRTTLHFSQRFETSCVRVASPLQLERFFIRHRCVASCKKNCFE